MNKLYTYVNKVLATTVSIAMGLLVIDVLWQVFTRFVLGNPSSFTEELARYLMIWVGLLGASYAAGKRMHLGCRPVAQETHGDAKENIKPGHRRVYAALCAGRACGWRQPACVGYAVPRPEITSHADPTRICLPRAAHQWPLDCILCHLLHQRTLAATHPVVHHPPHSPHP